ncbi:hypothetical protein EVA_11718 [gut metagenome]|uniref:Uncharacterized protein n=1 Tax=gut metagenome TaxID=749906 RepID=J9FYX6_9ZZZZ
MMTKTVFVAISLCVNIILYRFVTQIAIDAMAAIC